MNDKITIWDLLRYMKADTLAQMAADLDDETGVEADKPSDAVWNALVAVAGSDFAALDMIDKEAAR
jgi:hypothetical protein